MKVGITIGCSHTRLKYLPLDHRWPHIICKKRPDLHINYINWCRTGAGLVHLFARLKRGVDQRKIFPLKIDYFIIQKPQAIRYPWWNTETYDRSKLLSSLNSYANGGGDLVKGRKISIKKYAQLNDIESKEIALFIESKERDIIKELREMFSNARMAYYHYWGDYIIDSIQHPHLAEVNVRLGEFSESIGIDNWGTIVNPANIPGVYDKDGDILFDKNILHKEGWIYSASDPHGSEKYQQKVVERAEQWFG